MARFDEVYRTNHRLQQSLVLGVSAFGLLLSAAPRQERALFITDGTGIRAFGVNLPLPPFDLSRTPSYLVDGFLPRAFFARAPRGPGGPGVPGNAADPAGNPAAPFFAPAAGAGPGPGLLGGVPDVTNPGGGNAFPFTPPSLSPTTSSPAAPNETVDAPVVPVPTDTATPVPTVPAVPEPTTWLMMLIGFLVVGSAIRLRGAGRRPTIEAGA